MNLQSFQQEKIACDRPVKCFSNRSPFTHLEPYSQDFLKAKRKAYERYKKIYPANQKENLYQIAKKPHMGFYIMKGYKPKGSYLGQKQKGSSLTVKSSDKIISNLMKKYLQRKEQAESGQFDVLPRLQTQTELSQTRLNSINMKRNKKCSRMFTDYDNFR